MPVTLPCGITVFERGWLSSNNILIQGAHSTIPGHGSSFIESTAAISAARRWLDGFVRYPAKHRHYAAKVLLKFKLPEARAMKYEEIF